MHVGGCVAAGYREAWVYHEPGGEPLMGAVKGYYSPPIRGWETSEREKRGEREGEGERDRKSTRLNSSHLKLSRMPSSA